jgi:hypothetical protein
MALFYANFILPGIINNALRKFFPDIYQRDTVPKGVRLLYQCAVIFGAYAFILKAFLSLGGFGISWAGLFYGSRSIVKFGKNSLLLYTLAG